MPRPFARRHTAELKLDLRRQRSACVPWSSTTDQIRARSILL